MPATDTLARPARPARFDRSTQHGRAMLAKIQIARKQLAIDEDDYRQILLEETGKLSLKGMSEVGLERVLGRMKRLGFKPLPRSGANQARHPMAAKARALWISLHHLGVVRNASEEALEAFAKRQLGCDRLVWARQSDAYRLIEALKDMANRNGWSQKPAVDQGKLTPRELQERLCEAIVAKLKTAGVVPDEWTLDIAAWRLCGIALAGPEPVSPEGYARAAAALGAKLRGAGAAS